MNYDFVSFGDITTDCFIKLKEARVNCDINQENCMLCVRFGQKIPYESATELPAVGNGANAAVAAHRLGLKSALVTNLGDDANGGTCRDALEKEGVPSEFVRIHKGLKTNYHYVLQYEDERTILIKHEEYPYEMPVFPAPPRWIYLTSLPSHSLPYQIAIAEYARENNVLLAFQPGTYQIAESVESLAPVYRATEIFFCNKEESQRILKTDGGEIKKLLEGILALGPKIAVITDGRNGAYLADGSGFWFAPMYPDPKPPVSRTGAGDATSSTMTSYIALGLSPKEALLHGLVNAASVVQHVGAQGGLLSREEIEERYAKRPADFQIAAI
ncbi:MAG: carbohydrate kinase family protein [bacterium]|nr:carbohydrate kinase family protein [bacterium]